MQKKEIDKKDDIKKFIRLAHLSCYLTDDKPISLMLISPPESGKTHFLMSYEDKFSLNITDLSFMGIIHNMTKYPKFITLKIPDFVKITGKKRSTSDNLITFLNGFLEEGIFKIDLGNKNEINFNGRNGSMITATTKKSFEQNRRNWENIGFTSRFLIISYKYSMETFSKIISELNKGSNKKRKSIKIKCRKTKIEHNTELNKQLNKISNNSIRKLIHLQTLAKANALDNNRIATTQEDIDEVIRLNQYINLEFKEI